MKKFPIFLKIARWRMLSLFRNPIDQLQSRLVLISLITLCLIGPSVLAAYYRALSSFHDLTSWLTLSAIGIAFLSIHGKLYPENLKLAQFENTLPLSRSSRIAIRYLESIALQLPALFFIFTAAITDRLNFAHPQSWTNRLQVLALTALILFFNNLAWGLLPISKKSAAVKIFYVHDSVMKLKALLKNYPGFSRSTLLFIAILSFLGTAICRTPPSAQPKLFLYFLFFGFQILPLSKIPAMLADWDRDLKPLLNTLPASRRLGRWVNPAIFAVPAALLAIQASVWVEVSYASTALLAAFLLAAIVASMLFFQLQTRFAKWVIMAGLLITLTEATALQAAVH